MSKSLIALNLLVLTIAVVLALARPAAAAPQKSIPKWDLQTAVQNSMVPDTDKAEGLDDAEAADFKKGAAAMIAADQKGEKQFQADQRALLNKGYEPFAVTTEGLKVYGTTMNIKTIYFKKLVR